VVIEPMQAVGSRPAVEPAVEWSVRAYAGRNYARTPVKVGWLRPDDDLGEVLRSQAGLLEAGDTIAVSEKVVALLTGHAIPMSAVAPRRLARVLARLVRPREGSRGLSVPEKMEYVLRHAGTARVVVASLASAVTRPLRIRGIFYRVAGDVARDIDGGRPPYEDVLLPPLATGVAQRLCGELEGVVGVGVAIVDLNDFGGSIRATSPRALPSWALADVLRDNPMRQRLTGTPLVIVRPA